MTSDPVTEYERLPAAAAARIDARCDQFEEAWRAARKGGEVPSVSAFLRGVEGVERAVLARELVALDQAYRARHGLAPRPAGDRDHETLVSPGTAPDGASGGWHRPQIPGLELGEVLGVGGMGIVYRARQAALGRDVAVKFLREAHPDGSRHRERFEKEARAVAQLEHPHLVRVYDYGEFACAGGAGSQPYLVMEYVAGGNLAGLLGGLPQPPAEAAALVQTLAEAIHYAHEQGIIHRDLKPANVLLSAASGAGSGRAEAEPKITDFGLAKIQDEAALTHTHDVLGTPGYMSPEQLDSRYGPVTRAVDVYGLGAILYETLTGRPPFRAATAAATAAQVQADDPVSPRRLQPTVPHDLNTICLKCLRKSPGQRYASARDLADDLRRFLEGRPVLARPAGVAERARKWARRRPALAASLAAALALLAAGFAVVAGQSRQTAKALAESRQAHEVTRAHLYLNLIARARQELQARRVSRAERLLDETPEALRGWEWRYLKGQCKTSLLTLRGGGSEVLSVAYSPDGTRIAAGCGDWYRGRGGEVSVWDAQTGRRVHLLGPVADAVYAVAFHPDGRRVASAGLRGRVRIWDAAAGTLVRELEGHTATSDCVAFSPDGRLAAAGCRRPEPRVLVWDVETGRVVHRLTGHRGHIWGVAFSPDGRRIASCDFDGMAHLWDAETGAVLRSFAGPADHRAIAFSPDGVWLGVASYTGYLRFWDLTRPHAPGVELNPNAGPLLSLAFTPDGSPAWSSRRDDIRIMDLPSGRDRCEIRGHEGWAYSISPSPDGRRLASGGTDGTIRIGDATAYERPPRVLDDGAELPGLAFDPEGRLRALGGYGTRSVAWDVASGKRLFTSPTGPAPPSAAAGSPDGRLWAWVTGSTLRVRRPGAEAELWTKDLGPGRVTGLAVDFGGTRLAWGGNDGLVHLVGAADGAPIQDLRAGVGAVTGVAFHPDGRTLAAAGRDGTYALLSLHNARVLRRFGEPGAGGEPAADAGAPDPGVAPATRLAFSPDGRRLAAANGSRPLELWDVGSGRVVLILDGESQGVSSAAWSADGHRLAAAYGKRVQVWDDDGSGRDDGRRAWEMDPVAWHLDELRRAEGRRDWYAAVYHATKLIERQPAEARHRERRAHAHALRAEAGHGPWSAAAADFGECARLRPARLDPAYFEAVATLASGDADGYRARCARILDRFEGTDQPTVANDAAYCCCLAEDAVSDPARVVKLARRAVDRNASNGGFGDTYVLALYRAGDAAAAREAADELRRGGAPLSPLVDLFQGYYLALVHAKLGDADEARRWLSRAVRGHDHIAPDQPPPGTAGTTHWSHRVELQFLRQEATRLVPSPSGGGPG